MAIASFKNKVFQVSASQKNTFDGLGWSGALETEAQEKLQDKPSTYIKGLALDVMSFEVPLRIDFGMDVRAEIEQWEAIKTGTSPDYFILGTRPLGKNKWLLKSVGVSDTEIDGNGRLLRAKVKLDFEEYIRAGKAQPPKTTAAGTTNLNLSPTEYITNPPNKAEEKRNNPNLTAAQNSKMSIAAASNYAWGLS